MAATLKPNNKNQIGLKYVSPQKKFFSYVPYDVALTLVNDGMAIIKSPRMIHRLFDNKSFKKFILTRDNSICHYCGKNGNTIDHKIPKSKGGHTTPVNCVCACRACNKKKSNLDYEEFVLTKSK